MKILVVKLSSMGDMISTLPALTEAKAAIDNISFDWVAEENFIEIPSWHPAVDLVIPIALRRWRKKPLSLTTMREIQNFWNKLRIKQYDCIIDAQGLIKSAIVSKIARGISYGFSKNNAREPIASYFYCNKLDISKNLHAVLRIRQLFATTLGYKVNHEFLDYGITKEKFYKYKKEGTIEKYLVFIHSASRSGKCWQEEKWIALTHLAKKAGFKVKLPWGNESELIRAKNIAATYDNSEVLPKLTLTEIGSILLGAYGVVALDTGLGHLSAALSIPAISLYGSTSLKLSGTYGKNQSHLTSMGNLSAQDVWQKIEQEWASCRIKS